MHSDCIITQVHVPDYDVQGDLDRAQKLRVVEFSLKHLRRFNPNAYIILAGHGAYPHNAKLCDYVYWEHHCRPLDKHGYVVGMPAQYHFVSMGLEHAMECGFSQVLKTRGDCVIGIPNITAHCRQIVKEERRSLLVTQQTGPDRLGDCFMFGDTELLCHTWWRENPVYSLDGLQNTAHNFRLAMQSDEDWTELVRRTCAFRDVHKLKFTCLRWNFRKLAELSENIQEQLLFTDFEYELYHWGRANRWHVFDEQDNMTGTAEQYWSQKEFYGTLDS